MVEDYITVYSEQSLAVAQIVSSGQLHMQPWGNSAAYALASKGTANAHKRAYLWMASEFEKRMGRRLPAAPVWVGFDLRKVMSLRNAYRDRKVNERILELSIPRSELLISMYEPWCTQILEGHCIGDVVPRLNFRGKCSHPGKQRRQTWESIFNLSSDPNHWQGITDRIEPDWLVRVHC